MEELLRAIDELVKRLQKEGRLQDLHEEMDKLIRSRSWDSSFTADAQSIAQNLAETAYKAQKTRPLERQYIDSLDVDMGFAYDRVLEAVKRGTARGLTDKEIVRSIQEAEQQAQTRLNNTVGSYRAGLISMENVLKAEADGIKTFKYVGPDDFKVRPFCRRHLNHVYELSFIRTLMNDFGQPSLTWRGGWNCRHRWMGLVK